MSTVGAANWDLPQDTIMHALERAVADVPDKIFLDLSGDRYTYGEIHRMATELAHGLLSLGLTPGQPVGSVLDNHIDAIILWLAINMVGGVSAPVNTAYKGPFLRNQLNDCMANIIVVEAEYADRLAQIADELPHLRHLVVRGEGPLVGDGIPFHSLSRRGAEPLPNIATPDQLSMLIYTSGTTGASKGCMISHNHACNMGWTIARTRGYTAEDVLWTPLPLFHLNAIGTTILSAMVVKATAAISTRFSVSKFWPEIERTGATGVSLLGSPATFIAEAPDTDISRRCHGQIRRLLGAPIFPEVAQKWRERFGVSSVGGSGYGMTEAPFISSTLPDDPPAPAGSSGRSGIDFEVKIFDDDGLEVEPGQPGEIVARPNRPNVMFQGYWNKAPETVRAWRNLWFHTGDIGKLDEKGYLYFIDRKKDYLRRRGENISSLEIEAVFKEHPAILDVAVHAVPSPSGEDDLKVTAELKDGARVSEEELCRWSIDRLPYFAVPLYVEFRESLPRTPTGKVQKEVLRTEGKTPSTWDREAAGLTFTRR
jgi:crotonobetaine/carnitine-CoA ligase